MLRLGDCRDILRTLPDNSIDSIVTDPPYELGFMGKRWDSTGIAYDVNVWRECLRVLKPGGHLLAFGGSRTYHRLACAVEDAGFEIRDQIMWLYGSGFPKSLDVSKAIDKAAGAERKVTGRVPKLQSYGYDGNRCYGGDTDRGGQMAITAPATPDAARWQGWGTAQARPRAHRHGAQAHHEHRRGERAGLGDRGAEHRRMQGEIH
jgi:site-specific DNA-methyltransferase (adenine-specific)